MATPTPVSTIDATGCHVPDFSTIIAFEQQQYQVIYGADVVLTPDTQDGQWIGILSAGVNDTNAMALACYNSFSPSTAQGTGLSSVVKINGIRRLVPTASSVTLTIIGQAFTAIANPIGVVADANQNLWDIPQGVVIPASGLVNVTGTCETLGAVQAAPNTINVLNNLQPGLQSITNQYAALPGAPVETDAALRQRQTISTAIPSLSILDGLNGAIAAIPGVARFRVYENDTAVTAYLDDVTPMPANSISAVVDGGDQQSIVNVIRIKKGGSGTFGATSLISYDTAGTPKTINFFRPTYMPITWNVSLNPLANYTTATAKLIAQSLSDWTNAIGIGNSLIFSRAWTAANLYGNSPSNTFDIQGLSCSVNNQLPASVDVSFLMMQVASCDPTYVNVTVLT